MERERFAAKPYWEFPLMWLGAVSGIVTFLFIDEWLVLGLTVAWIAFWTAVSLWSATGDA